MKKTIYTAALFLILGIAATSCKKTDKTPTPTYPTDGLVSYFNFDDNLKDQKSNTPDGTNSGSATFTAGKAGKAITLNGIDQKITFARKSFKSGNNISVACWFKTADVGGLKFFLMCSDFANFTGSSFAGMAISLPSTNSAKGAYSASTWTHLVGTYDGTNIKTYINGVLAETKNHPGTISDLNRDLVIGNFLSEYWVGSIDDLFIYNKTVTQAEVTQLYNFH